MLRNRYRRLPFKKQLILFLALIGSIMGIMIGVGVYIFETGQVRKNTSYLINNTTSQTAKMFSNRLEIVLNQYNKMLDSIGLWRFLNHQYTDDGDSQKYQDMIDIYDKMNDIYHSNGEVMDSLYLKNSVGKSIQVYNDMVYDKVSAELDSALIHKYQDNYGYIWLNNHDDTIFKTRIPRNVISIIQRFSNPKGENTGTMILNLKSSYFTKLLEQVEISSNGYSILLSPDGYMASDTVKKEYQLTDAERKSIWEDIKQGKTNAEIYGSSVKQHLFIYAAPFSVNNWYLVSIVPYQDLVSNSRQLAYLLTFTIGIGILAILIISMFLAAFITKPIEKLTKQVVEFEKNPNVIFQVDSGYEITTLANGLSNLKSSVDRLLEQVRIEQEQKNRLRLLMLQAQIQPHFLYNTLASINQLINMNESEKASKMCEALSRFYRLGLSKGKDIISVREEIEHIENYLFIQQYRYEKDFEYSINVADHIMDMQILKLSLQPLVENAIYHGIKNKEEIGIIVISGYTVGDSVVVEVYDDGCGITEEKLKKINEELREGIQTSKEKEIGFGISNLGGRLKLFFGEEAQLIYESSQGVYTQAKITFPINRYGG